MGGDGVRGEGIARWTKGGRRVRNWVKEGMVRRTKDSDIMVLIPCAMLQFVVG